MCYSAECWALYDGYVKEFGADIDIKAFWELYLGRDEKYRIRHKLSDGTKIPKGVDLNFRQPRSELERKVQDLIGKWNGRKLAESEAELAAQEAEDGTAQAKLAIKETKTALNEQRIATNKIKQMTRWIEDAKKAHEARPHPGRPHLPGLVCARTDCRERQAGGAAHALPLPACRYGPVHRPHQDGAGVGHVQRQARQPHAILAQPVRPHPWLDAGRDVLRERG